MHLQQGAAKAAKAGKVSVSVPPFIDVGKDHLFRESLPWVGEAAAAAVKDKQQKVLG